VKKKQSRSGSRSNTPTPKNREKSPTKKSLQKKKINSPIEEESLSPNREKTDIEYAGLSSIASNEGGKKDAIDEETLEGGLKGNDNKKETKKLKTSASKDGFEYDVSSFTTTTGKSTKKGNDGGTKKTDKQVKDKQVTDSDDENDKKTDDFEHDLSAFTADKNKSEKTSKKSEKNR